MFTLTRALALRDPKAQELLRALVWLDYSIKAQEEPLDVQISPSHLLAFFISVAICFSHPEEVNSSANKSTIYSNLRTLCEKYQIPFSFSDVDFLTAMELILQQGCWAKALAGMTNIPGKSTLKMCIPHGDKSATCKLLEKQFPSLAKALKTPNVLWERSKGAKLIISTIVAFNFTWKTPLGFEPDARQGGFTLKAKNAILLINDNRIPINTDISNNREEVRTALSALHGPSTGISVSVPKIWDGVVNVLIRADKNRIVLSKENQPCPSGVYAVFMNTNINDVQVHFVEVTATWNAEFTDIGTSVVVEQKVGFFKGKEGHRDVPLPIVVSFNGLYAVYPDGTGANFQGTNRGISGIQLQLYTKEGPSVFAFPGKPPMHTIYEKLANEPLSAADLLEQAVQVFFENNATFRDRLVNLLDFISENTASIKQALNIPYPSKDSPLSIEAVNRLIKDAFFTTPHFFIFILRECINGLRKTQTSLVNFASSSQRFFPSTLLTELSELEGRFANVIKMTPIYPLALILVDVADNILEVYTQCLIDLLLQSELKQSERDELAGLLQRGVTKDFDCKAFLFGLAKTGILIPCSLTAKLAGRLIDHFDDEKLIDLFESKKKSMMPTASHAADAQVAAPLPVSPALTRLGFMATVRDNMAAAADNHSDSALKIE